MPDEVYSYDPDGSNSPNLEALAFRDLDINHLTIEELTNPQVVQFLIFNYKLVVDKNSDLMRRMSLYEQKIESLNTQRENLRVDMAALRERSNKTWFEIPGALLMGFGTNLITGENGKIGLALLLIGFLMVIVIRSEQLIAVLTWIKNFFTKEGNTNG